MAKDRHAGEVVRSLHRQGWIVYKDAIDFVLSQRRAMGEIGEGGNGRADLVALKDGMGIAVEIKNGKGTFNLDMWSRDQRDYAVHCEECGVPYSIWLILGKDKPNLNPEKYEPRKAWLVPHRDFRRIELLVRQVQKTLIYRIKKGVRLELREKNLDAVTLLAPFELQWDGGIWRIPGGNEIVYIREGISLPSKKD